MSRQRAGFRGGLAQRVQAYKPALSRWHPACIPTSVAQPLTPPRPPPQPCRAVPGQEWRRGQRGRLLLLGLRPLLPAPQGVGQVCEDGRLPAACVGGGRGRAAGAAKSEWCACVCAGPCSRELAWLFTAWHRGPHSAPQALHSFCSVCSLPTPPTARRHVVTIDGYEDVPANDAESLQKALAHQPVAVAICASPAMQVWLRVVGGRQAGRLGW